MRIWMKRMMISAVLIVSIMLGLTQNTTPWVSAKAQNNLSVVLKLDSKKVNRKTVTMTKGSSKKISLSITSKKAKVKKSFRTNKKNIVTVTKAGLLKAKSKGTAKITVTVTDKGKGKKKAWFRVKVVTGNKSKDKTASNNKSNADSKSDSGSKDNSGNKSDSDKDSTSTQKTEIPVTLTVNGKTFNAKFYNNKTARELIEKMPMTLSMKELNGNEKYHYFDTDFSTDAKSPKQINAGDIMLYGSDCLVTFYKTFTTSYKYTSVGYVQDASGFAKAVGKGNVKITFQSQSA